MFRVLLPLGFQSLCRIGGEGRTYGLGYRMLQEVMYPDMFFFRAYSFFYYKRFQTYLVALCMSIKVMYCAFLGHLTLAKVILYLRSGAIFAELFITTCTAQNGNEYCVFDRTGQIV